MSSSVWDRNSAGGASENRHRLTVSKRKPVRDPFDFQCRMGDRPPANLLGKIEEAGFLTIWAHYVPRKRFSFHSENMALFSHCSLVDLASGNVRIDRMSPRDHPTEKAPAMEAGA
jgi:hypothetical protein